MCPADKEAFSSFAHAQVAITNAVYQHLGEPETFLFCPTGQAVGSPKTATQRMSTTQYLAPLNTACVIPLLYWMFSIIHTCSVPVIPDYCAAFCTPNVSQSSYLHTVGEKLLPGIDILWTGEAALSHDLTVNLHGRVLTPQK